MIFSTIVELDVIDSTNSFLKERSLDLASGTVVRAKHQTAGRGQFDRIWTDNPGENVLFSILLKDVAVQKLEALKNRTASAVMTLLSRYGIQARFKEPNDLYAENRKLAGFLVETKTQGTIAQSVVIGIGLNVNQTDFAGLNAISMRELCDQFFDTDEVFANLIQELMAQYSLWESI